VDVVQIVGVNDADSLEERVMKSLEKRTSANAERVTVLLGVTLCAMGALLTFAQGAASAEAPQAARLAPRVLKAIYGAFENQQTRRFDIPPGPLETVLATFQKLTDLQVLVSDEELHAIPSPGVSGVYTVERALAQILAGTGVSHRFSGPKIVTLELEGMATKRFIGAWKRITTDPPTDNAYVFLLEGDQLKGTVRTAMYLKPAPGSGLERKLVWDNYSSLSNVAVEGGTLTWKLPLANGQAAHSRASLVSEDELLVENCGKQPCSPDRPAESKEILKRQK
jgi:hypothetical protein